MPQIVIYKKINFWEEYTPLLRFGHKALTFETLNTLVQALKLKFRRDFEAEVWSVFCC